jgi:ketosteroid isomerase-like protein
MSAQDAPDDFERTIEQSHAALDAFARGDPELAAKLWSTREDITLGNPFGTFARGMDQVLDAMRRAASNYRDGGAVGFDLVAKEVTPELAYLVEVERLQAKMGTREDVTPVALRVTSIFRREDGGWRLVHRHADPITEPRSAESVVQQG